MDFSVGFVKPGFTVNERAGSAVSVAPGQERLAVALAVGRVGRSGHVSEVCSCPWMVWILRIDSHASGLRGKVGPAPVWRILQVELIWKNMYIPTFSHLTCGALVADGETIQ